jgi:hypothetical protein
MLVAAPKNLGTWTISLHDVGSKSDGGIYTCDLSGRLTFRTRAERRAWLNPTKRQGNTKFAHGGFVPALFGDSLERKNWNARGTDAWVVLDFDGLPTEAASRFGALAPLTGEWLTSYSQGIKPGGRIRMVLELDRALKYDKSSGVDEVSPARAAASYYVAELLGLDAEALAESNVIDRLCWRVSQYYNTPCHDPKRPGDTYFAELNGGHVLSVDALLAKGRSLVKVLAGATPLKPGEYPAPTPRDRELALEDLETVCSWLEAHRGSGFGYSYVHVKRLGGRVALGQLAFDEAEDCLLSAVADGLDAEAEESSTKPDADLLARREAYVRAWLNDPYVHSGLIASKLEFSREA